MALNALFTGSSALTANSQVLDVVGNNLANLNTVGFKSQRVQFKDLLYQSVQAGTALSGNIGSTNPQQIGFGVQTGSIGTDFESGSSTATGRDLDVSISGNGFFVAFDGTQNVYTRSGAFDVDSSGFLVDSNTGFRIQRFGTSGEGNALAGIPAFQTFGDNRIRVPFGATVPGNETGNVNFVGNLSASLQTGETYSVPSQIFDSQGNSRALTVTFTRAAVTTPGATSEFNVSVSISGVAPGDISFNAGNILNFDAQGQVSGPATGTLAITVNNIPSTGETQTISLNFGTPGQVGGVTNAGGPSSTGAITQDGIGLGTLTEVNVDQSGVIQGIFTNGRVLEIAQLAIADFVNVGGLNREGNNYFSTSSASGEALIGGAGTGGRGLASRGTLEGSNVDISIEFSRLIIAQRGFQVNTRTITAANEILQELANIIR